MSTTENGVAARAPKILTIPDDMDPAAMTILAACLEGLADRSAIMSVFLDYRTIADARIHVASGPSGIGTWTAPAGFELTLPATILATDIIEVEADFEGKSTGSNDVEFAIGFLAATDTNNQTWDHTIRKVTSTATRERLHIRGVRDCSGLGTGISLAALKVSLFAQPLGADDAEIYGPGTFTVRVTRKA